MVAKRRLTARILQEVERVFVSLDSLEMDWIVTVNYRTYVMCSYQKLAPYAIILTCLQHYFIGSRNNSVGKMVIVASCRWHTGTCWISVDCTISLPCKLLWDMQLSLNIRPNSGKTSDKDHIWISYAFHNSGFSLCHESSDNSIGWSGDECGNELHRKLNTIYTNKEKRLIIREQQPRLE